jgi:hypothetical protein
MSAGEISVVDVVYRTSNAAFITKRPDADSSHQACSIIADFVMAQTHQILDRARV